MSRAIIAKFSTVAVRPPKDEDDPVFPCMHCGVLRSINQGGKVFTACDDCAEKEVEEDEA